MKRILLALSVVLCALSFAGCVRVAGTAGYWKTDAEGDLKAKQVGFDTANLGPNDKAPGSITV